MKAWKLLIFAAFALSLAGCQTTALNDGAGYELLKPLPTTAAHITKNDPQFARAVAAHNRQCRKDEACKK